VTYPFLEARLSITLRSTSSSVLGVLGLGLGSGIGVGLGLLLAALLLPSQDNGFQLDDSVGLLRVNGETLAT
jgi:hypothetical protein